MIEHITRRRLAMAKRPKKLSDKRIINTYQKTSNSVRRTAKACGRSYMAIRLRLVKLGIL
jgi:hypothetical protein